jgi:hypothetical protein
MFKNSGSGCTRCTVHCSSVHSFFTPETSARRSLLRQFRQRRDFSYYFAVCSPSATIFVFSLSVFARISLRNLQTIQFCWREAGIITVLHSTPVLSFCTVYFCLPLTAQIQQCRCTDPGPSPIKRSHSYSGRFHPVCSFQIVCVTFRPTEQVSV